MTKNRKRGFLRKIGFSRNLWDTKNFFEILMITLISSKNLGGDRNMNNTVDGKFMYLQFLDWESCKMIWKIYISQK